MENTFIKYYSINFKRNSLQKYERKIFMISFDSVLLDWFFYTILKLYFFFIIIIKLVESGRMKKVLQIKMKKKT